MRKKIYLEEIHGSKAIFTGLEKLESVLIQNEDNSYIIIASQRKSILKFIPKNLIPNCCDFDYFKKVKIEEIDTLSTYELICIEFREEPDIIYSAVFYNYRFVSDEIVIGYWKTDKIEAIMIKDILNIYRYLPR